MDKIAVCDIHYFMSRSVMEFSRYLPVNKEALRWGIHCNSAGYGQVPAGSDYPLTPRNHPKTYADTVTTGRVLREFQVVYISSGSGWLKGSDGVSLEIIAGDVFMLFPGILHSYSPHKDTGWHEYWVGFSGEHAQRLFQNGLFQTDNPIHHIGLDRDIMADLEQIIRLCRQQSPGFQVLLGALILQLLAHIHVSEITEGTTHGDSELVETARSIINLHLEDGIEVEDIASEIGVSYVHLLEIFRKYTGLTPYQYYLQLRIHRAKELLLDDDLSIKEIAAQMNFENQYYFSRLFKKKTGFAPSLWRNSSGIM